MLIVIQSASSLMREISMSEESQLRAGRYIHTAPLGRLQITYFINQLRDQALAELEALKKEHDEGKRIRKELERLQNEHIRMQEQAKKDNELVLHQKLEIERLTQENIRLNAEADRLSRAAARREEEITKSPAAIEKTTNIELGLSMLGSIDIRDVQKLSKAHWEKMDQDLIRIRDLALDTNKGGEISKTSSIPAATENMCDRFNIRYDVKDGNTVYWSQVNDQSRPKKERFLNLLLYRRWYLERPGKNHSDGGHSTFRLVFWLGIVYRLLEMRELWG